MTIAVQPSAALINGKSFARNEATFNATLKIPEICLNLLQESTDGYIPGQTFNIPQMPGLTLQPLFAVRLQPGEGKKLVVALRINKTSTHQITTLPYEIDYNVKFESGNFSKRYRATSIPVNPSYDIEIFNALAMKVFNFDEIFVPKNNFIYNGEIGVNIYGSIRA